QTARYPAVKRTVGTRRATRATCRAAGTAEGSIIAAVIVTQSPRYPPSPPRSVPGPASIPRIRSTVTAHATTAPATSTTVVRLRAMRFSVILASFPVLITSRRAGGRKLIGCDEFPGGRRSHFRVDREGGQDA